MTMKLLTKWIRALRSGRYKKGTGQLLLKDKYCVLGVLCDVSKMGRWAEQSIYQEERAYIIDFARWKNQCTRFLHHEISAQLAKETGQSTWDVKEFCEKLYELNDAPEKPGYGLKRLANLIENEFPGTCRPIAADGLSESTPRN